MPHDPGDLVRHDISVRNIIYGEAHFMTLRLAHTWEIAPGVGHPEVVAAHDRNRRKWVASGTAWYVLYHRELGWAMEVKLESGGQKKNFIPQGEMMDIQGHTAQVKRWTRRRGIFRPRQITFVELKYNCPESDRFIRVELSGRCPGEAFDQVEAMVREWWCH